MTDTALGTFTVTVDGDQIGLGVENHAHLTIQVQGERSVLIDDVADKIHFPMTARGGKRIKFPYELKLFTDVPAGSTDLSEQVGYYIEIRTPLGGLVQSTFAARAADSTVSLTDLTETVVTAKSDQVRLRDETRGYRDEAEAAAAAATAIGSGNDAAVASRLRLGPLTKQALADELADTSSPAGAGLIAEFGTVGIDTDGVYYLTDYAGLPGTPIQIDTDGVYYIATGA